jgi:carboxymethylenebutenolidase
MRRALLTLLALAVAVPVFAQQPAPVDVPWNDAIAPGTAEHAARALKESSRHQEWVDIKMADGGVLKSFVVYPERATPAPVVVVIHDIRGMSDIARAAGDQLAQDGFIAIVPDFLSGKGPDGGGTDSLGAAVGKAIQSLSADEVTARLNAAMEYGRSLPASNKKTGVTGFCWGGGMTFMFATKQPALDAGVVFYGPTPGTPETFEQTLSTIQAPLLGLYADNDARINTVLPEVDAVMKKLGKSYERHMFEGSGHGFMGNQAGAGGANLKAALQAWPMAVAFFKKHLE